MQEKKRFVGREDASHARSFDLTESVSERESSSSVQSG